MATVASGRAGAQSDSTRARSVTLVEVAFPARGRSAMIFHRRVGPDRDVIALGPNATSDDLGSAIRALSAMYADSAQALRNDMAASVRAERALSGRDTVRAKIHDAFLRELRRSKDRHVMGFGSVRAFEVKLPARARAN